MGTCILRRFGKHMRWLLTIVLMQQALLTDTAVGSQLEELAIRAGFRVVARGSSTTEHQKQTSAAFPLRQMQPENRQRALAVIDKCSQYRRLPELQYAVDPAMYQYLVRHPDVAVSTWRVMGISQFEMWQTGAADYEAQAVDGSEGLASVLFQDQNNCIFLCDGRYQNPLLPRSLEASALVWFRYAFTPTKDGLWLVSQKADIYVSFPSQGLSTVAKVIAPVTNSMMDRNLYEVSLYASLMSRAVRDEPEWVIQVARQMEGVLPQRSNELIAVARQPRNPVPQVRRSESDGTLMVDRRLLDAGVLLFDPPRPEELAAVPGNPAISGPQVPAQSGTPAAAGSSVATFRAQSASSSAATGDTDFVLQPSIIPPLRKTDAADHSP